MIFSSSVIINSFGYYEVVNKPSEEELAVYYEKKYFQQQKGHYDKMYSDAEIQYFNNKIKEKEYILDTLFTEKKSTYSLLDIGCGEGWTLNYFSLKNWNVTGLDFSDEGCRIHNPQCLNYLIKGNIYNNLELLFNKSLYYDVIWLDNVLEHVINPFKLLQDCKKISHDNSILVVDVPNDFSAIQQYALSQQYINTPFWINEVEHLSYFNKQGLVNLANEVGWHIEYIIADHPIDFNLLNENSNYVTDKTKGKACHKMRVEIDNLMHTISLEKTVNYYKALADLGLGRQIIAFFKLKN